jgi:hypothetical protein
MRYLGGHLGDTVSALLDGQLDSASAERAWAHVHACALCDQQVKREGWVKTQLASVGREAGPPPQLLGSLYALSEEGRAWQAVHAVEHRERGRRRTGLVLAGAGSVSAVVLGLAGLSGAIPGFGPAQGGAPAASITGPGASAQTPGPTAVVAPRARAHGHLRLDRQGGGDPDLRR